MCRQAWPAAATVVPVAAAASEAMSVAQTEGPVAHWETLARAEGTVAREVLVEMEVPLAMVELLVAREAGSAETAKQVVTRAAGRPCSSRCNRS